MVLDNVLFPLPVDRTKIPTVYPVQNGEHWVTDHGSGSHDTWYYCVCHLAISKLEHDTRYWPLVYNDTIFYTLKQVSPALYRDYSIANISIANNHRACMHAGGQPCWMAKTCLFEASFTS